MSGYGPVNASNPGDSGIMDSFKPLKKPVRVALTVIFCGFAIMGFVAFMWDEGYDDSGGKFLTRYDRFCVPNSHVAIYQSAGSRAALTNITTVEVKQTGHKIELTVQFLRPFEMAVDDDSDTIVRAYIDSRCIPPARVFNTCVGGVCSAAATSTDELVNLTMTDQWFQSTFSAPAILLTTGQDEFATSFSAYPIQGLNIQGSVDDINYFGQLVDVYVSAGMATGNVGIPSLTIHASYNTNSSKHWHVPSFCTGGPCLDEDLAY